MILNNVYVLNPYYSFRNDKKRVVLCNSPAFKIPEEIAEEDTFVFIHPVFAVIMSFFNGIDSLDKVLSKIEKKIQIPYKQCYNFILPFLENSKRIGIEYDDVSFEFPKNMLIDNSDNKFESRFLYYENYMLDDTLDFKTSRLFEGPTSLSILINTICATDCMYCYVDRRIKDTCKIPIERIRELINEAKKMGVINFDISGTEVFLYKHWYELVSELIKNNYYPYLSTKLPISEKIIVKLKSLGITDLQISIDTLDEDISVLVNQNRKGNYIAKMLHTLQLLEKHKINVAINTVLTKYNSDLGDLKEMLDKLSEFSNIEIVTLNPAERSLGTSAASFDAFKNSATELENIHFFCQQLDYKYKLSFASYIDKSEFESDFETKYKNYDSRSMCTANVSQICILSDGQVTICEELYWDEKFIIGNVLDTSIEEIWKSKKAKNLYNLKQSDFSKDSQCTNCSYFENCRMGQGVCWSNVIMAYGEENWDFPSPNCPYAPLPYNSIHHN